MEKKEIMDALELCASGCNGDGCVYNECAASLCENNQCVRCMDLLAKDVLDIIHNQDQEIEALEAVNRDVFSRAQEIMKKNEPVKPRSISKHGSNPQIQHRCGNCNQLLYGRPKYCSNCGRPVRWEE